MAIGIRGKIIGLCVAFSAVSVTVGTIGFYSSKQVSKEYSWIAETTLTNVEHVNHMFAEYRKVRIGLRSLGITHISKEDAAHAIQDAKDAIAEFDKTWDMYEKVPFTNGEEELANKMHDEWEKFKAVGGEVLNLYATGKPEDIEKMTQIFFTTCPERAKNFTVAVNALLKLQERDAQARVDHATAESNKATMISLVAILIGLMGGLGFGVVFSNRLSNSLRELVLDLDRGAGEVSSASGQLSQSSQQLSSGASGSAASLQESVASLHELSSMVKQNADNASQAAHLSTQGSTEVSAGVEGMGRLVNTMQAIHQSSQRIEEIITVIDDIAFQTNLLALNAAVEAARAGEQGKGFAVVADAVRALAQKSAASAKDISDLIKTSSTQISQGVKIADENGETLQSIKGTIQKISDLNGEIAQASTEQTKGLDQITSAFTQLDQTVQGNAATSEEVAASAEEMSAQSRNMYSATARLFVIVDGEEKKAA